MGNTEQDQEAAASKTTNPRLIAARALRTAKALIQTERNEQVTKHGYSPEHDDKYKDGELVKAANFCITKTGWPHGWAMEHMNHIAQKPYKERVTIAAAFMQAELERVLRAGGE